MFGKKKVQERVSPPTHASFCGNNLARVDFSELLTTSGHARTVVVSSFVNKESVPLEPTQAEFSVAEALDVGISALREGNFDKAGDCFQKVVFIDLEHEIAQNMLKMADYWVEKSRRYKFLSNPERVNFLLESWKNFHDVLLSHFEVVPERALFAIQGWVFGEAAKLLEQQLKDEDNPGLYLKLGRAYKMRGDYDLAIEAYTEGVAQAKNNPCLLAELADCYAVVDEEAHARLFFREALFHGAMSIDFDYLESAMILNLQKKVKEIRPAERYSPEWLGVYGVLWGIFSVTRELAPTEYARLNQSIHMLRSEIEDIPLRREILVPRLIYKLFWLIDYYKNLTEQTDAVRARIQSALLDIRFLDERIAKEYKL